MACAELGVWKAWRKFSRKHRAQRPFVLPGSHVAVVARPGIEHARLDGTTLTIPLVV